VYYYQNPDFIPKVQAAAKFMSLLASMAIPKSFKSLPLPVGLFIEGISI